MTSTLNFAERRARKIYYEQEILKKIPGLLSAMDRCPISETSGCLDREYWAWATKDFANMDLQRALAVLAYVYRTSFPGNIYEQQQALLDWITAGIGYWIKRQSRYGAFDHLYPNENSWMATGFTLLDLAETYILLQDKIDATISSKWLQAMIRAGRFLVQYDEVHGFISNHRAGTAAALLALFHLTKMNVFHQRAWYLMEEVYQHQSEEGWFLEYEGPDPGYQTLDTHYQALFFLHATDDQRVLKAVKRSLEFLSYFVHPDCSIGGDYGSRSCPQYFPGGFEIFAKYLPEAESIARAGLKGLNAGYASGLADADFRNTVPLLTSYILAHRGLSQEGDYPSASLPFERDFERLFPQAGFYIQSSKTYYAVVGASKGGVLKVFSKKSSELAHTSTGYTVRLTNGVNGTTLMWTSVPKVNIEHTVPEKESSADIDRKVSFSAPFYRFRIDRLMYPIRLVLFRIFSSTIGRIPKVNNIVRKHFIIRRYLKVKTPFGGELKRTLVFGLSSVQVDDQIRIDAPDAVDDLKEHGFFATVYMASARYFRQQDFAQSWSSENLANELKNGVVNRSYTINVVH